MIIQTRRTLVQVLCIIILFLSFIQVTWMYRDSLPSISIRHKNLIEADLHCYGDDKCFPDIRTTNVSDLNDNINICQEQHPEHQGGHKVRVATVTAQFGEPQDHYKRALRSHLRHSMIHEAEVHILCTKIVDDLWNKPAFILDLLLSEMEKPESKRLEWLFWVDRDTIILDNCRSPSSFLPPATKPPHKTGTRKRANTRPDVNLIATKDWNGLNNGVFLLRVNRWSVDLFAAILALRYFRPGVVLDFTEQSAMGLLLEESQFQEQVAWVPQWWFNAYPRPAEDFDESKVGSLEEYQARKGDFLVHFAGLGNRDESMPPWLDVAENATRKWSLGPPIRDVDDAVVEYWRRWN